MFFVPGFLCGPKPDAVHPIDEAGVYLSHGMPWAAIACLRVASDAVGTPEETDWAMPLDKRQLLKLMADIERQYPSWQQLQHAHQRRVLNRRLKRLVLVSVGAAAMALATKLILF